MKKLLAMVLALVMTLSLAVSASAVKADEKINEDYAEAVAVLNGMGVFKGYEDGSFKPENNITRAEVATIIYRIYTGDVAKNDKSGLYASYNKFTDMAGAGWAAGYIGYCSNAELVKGYPNGTFQPSGNITGYEVLAMILRAVGYDKNGEFTGADWAVNVAMYAEQLHILDNVAKTTNLGAPASRELVAEILFRAIQSPMVTYTAAFGYQNVGLNGDKDGKLFQNNVSLGKKNFKLESKDTADKFGRPTITWNYNTGDEETVIAVKPLATFTEPAKNCEVYDESGLAKATKLDVYTNSATKDGTYVIADNKEDSKQAMQGRLTEVYKDRLVNVDTYLAEITKTVAEKTDAKGHVTKAYVLVDKDVYGYEGKTLDNKFVTKDEYKVDDLVLITVADGEIQSMVKAENKGAVLTGVLGNRKTIDDIQKVTELDKEDVKINHTAKYQPEELTLGKTYTFYFDTYGNVIGAEELASNYAVLDTLYTDTVKGVDTAFGDLYFFDGESKTDVTINEVVGDDAGDFESAAKKNDYYYRTVYAYTVDKDGAYTLDNSEFESATLAEYKNGNKYIEVATNNVSGRLQLSKDTKILLQTKDSPKGTFTQYTGFEKLPSFLGERVQYTVVDGYVDMIYVYAYELTTRTVFLYDVEGYATMWNDGKPYTTFKALELVDDKLEEVKIDLYIPENWDTNGHDIPVVGLYEITMSSDEIWAVDAKYSTYAVTQLDGANKRIRTNDGLWFNLDDAIVAKYEGGFTKGEVDQEWTTQDLTDESILFIQIDETKNKTDDTYDALAVYDLFINVPVTVNGNETKDVEYWLKDFNNVTVDLKEYEMIDTAKMSDDEGVENLDITYYDLDGKEIKDFDAVKGTKVSKAVISCNDVVTGPIEITTMNQPAYANAKLVEDDFHFDKESQTFSVYTVHGSDYHTIIVELAGGNVSAEQLVKEIKAQAQGSIFQNVSDVYNTRIGDVFEGNLTAETANDLFIIVTSGDGKTATQYAVQVMPKEAGNN